MRRAFAETLAELAKEDPRIVLLTADLGFMALEPFADAFPERFFNVGVAEQNMIGVATGLAEGGLIPFVYSIVTFATLRPLEFIRNGPVAHQLPVRLVSVGGGFEYSHNGISHYGVEDVALMRSQPGMSIICPYDATQARAALRATRNVSGPMYFRLAKDDGTTRAEFTGRFRLGKADVLCEGDDVALIALGPMADAALSAAQKLEKRGVGCAVVSVSSIAPDLNDNLAGVIGRFPLLVTVEAHYVTGGLGSLASEIVAERNLPCRVVRCGIKALPDGRSGSKAFLQHEYGISSAALVQTVLDQLHPEVAS
jgi:transketolase